METKQTPLWLALVMTGCLDLALLDDMVPMDAGITGASAGGSGDNGEGGGNTDTGGAPTPDASDKSPPQLTALPCAPEERADENACIAEGAASVALRFGTDESASVALVQPQETHLLVFNEPWATVHYAAVVGIPQGEAVDIELRVEDINGNSASHVFTVQKKEGPAVVLTEVLADPFGPEPAQEFVEIVNLGSTAVDLTGWMIDDNGDANGDTLAEGTMLGAGEVALLVSPEYDPTNTDGPVPPASARIIRLASAIGSNGLKNSEPETLALYDGSLGSPREGVSVVRRAPELPEGSPWLYLLDPNGTSTPGEVPPVAPGPLE